MARVRSSSEIAAIVPRIAERGRILSPEYFLFDAFPRYFPRGFEGIAKRTTYAFNSASTLRVSALREIGGYDPLFWLDYSDAHVYSRLNKSGKKIYVAGTIQVEHEFSMSDKKKRMTAERYRNIVDAGCAFWDMELGIIAGVWHTARLLLRLLKHLNRGDDPSIRRITWAMLVSRITQSRRQRIARWRAARGYRPVGCQEEVATSGAEAQRERVSVCMAAHNGERYIEMQINSILGQLESGDELIIVDDASTDTTRDCVRQIRDVRIRLVESEKNEGVLATFEKAIRKASGSIVFLSDQDDIWDPRKISTTLEAFHRDRKVKVVVTGTCLIDERGREIAEVRGKVKTRFSDGFVSNLIRNKYQGCTMAFRADLIPAILPFPVGYDVLHDVWIRSRNRLSGGGTAFIDEPLVRYRRHRGKCDGEWKAHAMAAVASSVRSFESSHLL